MEVTADELKKLTPDEIKMYIRGVKGEDRFEMSGYNIIDTNVEIHNRSILDKFAFLGIYDYTNFLYLDFFKGTVTLFYRYFRYSFEEDVIVNAIDLTGYSTTEIIYKIFELTIFSDNPKRRRE